MTWTDPATASVAEMIDAIWMNTYVRDQFVEVDTHTHSGAAGDGAATLDGVDKIQFDHPFPETGAPAAGQTEFYCYIGPKQITNGGSAESFSMTTHTH